MALFDGVLNRVSEGWRRAILPPPSLPRAQIDLTAPSSLLSSSPFLSSIVTRSPFRFNQPRQNFFEFQFRRPDQGNDNPFTSPPLDQNIPAVNGDASKARGLEGTRQWQPLIERAAKEAGIPWQVISAIMGIESGGNATARSGVGATGLMQIMPNIWGSLAKNYGTGNLNDPYTNIRTGAEILKRNFAAYGSWDRAITAYFTGHPDPDGSSDGGATDYEYLNLFHNNLSALGFGQQSSSGGGSGWKVTGGVKFAMTQGFGKAETSSDVAHLYRGGAHPGLDFGTPYGTTLFSPDAGTVVWAGDRGDGYGNSVLIKAGNHYLLLGHLSQITVQTGQQINAGAYLGRSGGTGPGAGSSTGNHLHLEVRDLNGTPQDPRRYYAF